MPESETLKIVIQLRDEARRNLEKLNKELKGLDRQAGKTGRAFDRMRRGLRGLGTGISRIGKSLFNMRTAMLAAGAAIGAVFLAKDLINAADEQAKAVEGLDQALRAMGRFTPELSQNLQDVAKELQAVTNFGDEATIEGQKFLATYVDITDDLLPRSTRIMADLAALMGGDMVQAANLLGKASLGMTGSLRRIGVTVDQTTFKMGGYSALLDQIESQVGGQAEAQRRATGSLIGLGNAIGDAKEVAGEFIKTALEPTVRAIADEVNKLNEYLAKLQKEGKFDEWAKDASDSIVDFVEIVVKSVAVLVDAFRGLKLIWLGLKAAFSLLAEFTLKGLALMADAVDDIRKKIQEMGGDAAKVGKVLQFTPGLQGLGKALIALEENNIELGKTGKLLRGHADEWFKITNATSDQIVELAKQESALSKADKFIDSLRKRAQEYTKEIGKAVKVQEQLGKPDAAEAELPLEAQLKSALARATAVIDLELATIDDAYDRNLKSLGQYFDKRQALAEENFRNESNFLKAIADLEKDPVKKQGILDKEFALQRKFEADMIKLKSERFKAEEALEAGRAAITERQQVQTLELAIAGGANLQLIHDQERELLLAAQEQEIQDLIAQNATKAQIEEQYRLQQLELDQQAAEQRKVINELVLTGIMSSLDSMSQAFGDAYAASGQKAKEFFYAQKAIAIVQTGIETYKGAQAAFTAMAGIPYVGPVLGAIAAAAAIAAGLARIAAIRNQSLAEGGPVKGYSPTSKSDNIPAMLTADEFVQPVETVKYYGKTAMEAIRRRLIPREALQGFSFPKIPHPSYAFQTGGAVASRGSTARGPRPPTPGQAAAGAEGGGQQAIAINNIIDPQMMDQYVSSRPGQRNIMNVMSQNAFALKQIIVGDG